MRKFYFLVLYLAALSGGPLVADSLADQSRLVLVLTKLSKRTENLKVLVDLSEAELTTLKSELAHWQQEAEILKNRLSQSQSDLEALEKALTEASRALEEQEKKRKELATLQEKLLKSSTDKEIELWAWRIGTPIVVIGAIIIGFKIAR